MVFLGGADLVVDLSATRSVDAESVRELAALQRHTRALGCRFRLVPPEDAAVARAPAAGGAGAAVRGISLSPW